jgi:hypothetical protein
MSRRWAGGSPLGSARLLMDVQMGMGAAGNVLLLAAALFALALLPRNAQGWTAAAGSPLGWIALLAAVAAYAYRSAQLATRLHPQNVGLLGLAVLGLLACTVQWQFPGSYWGYRTLMLGWAMYAWFIVSATWWVASVRTLPGAQGPPQALIRAAAVWVRVAGMLAVLLGLKAAFWHHEEQLWAAAAIAVASAAGATMGVWRRREGWAFSAALGVNLAASLVVWHFQQTLGFQQWWLRLLQANVIASSAVALAWLAARKRLYQLRELTLGQSPLLATQTAIPVAGSAILLILPVVWLILQPADLPGWMTRLMAQMAEVPGWLGLLLAAAAAAWYLRQVLPGNLLHVLGGLALGAGVLLACHADQLSHRFGWLAWDAWLQYHVLTIAWALAGLLVLGVGLWGRDLRLAAQDERRGNSGESINHRSPIIHSPTTAPPTSRQLVFPAPLVQGWATAIGCLVLLLAVVHCAADPTSPWLSGWAVLSVSVLAGVLALWLKQPAYVFISGLLLNVIGVIAWIAWAEPAWPLPAIAEFAQTNVLCFGLGSALWSLLKLTLPTGIPEAEVGGRGGGRVSADAIPPTALAFSHLAARCAAALLAAVVAAAVASHVLALRPMLITGRLDWLALAATVAAVTICLWDQSSRFALPGLYGLTLLAVGMGLCARGITSREFCHASAVELAAFVLATAVLAALLPKLKDAFHALRIPEDSRRWPTNWFPAVQASLVGIVAMLSVWVSLDFAFDETVYQPFGWWAPTAGWSGRLAGPLAATALFAAALLMARRADEARPPIGGAASCWRYAALSLGLAVCSELGWARLDPLGAAPWLHRSVILMMAAVATTFVAGLGLRRLLPERSDWITSGRRMTPVLGGLALVMLAAVLIQEGILYYRFAAVPMAWPAIVVVVGCLAALVAGCLGFAVVRRWDPLGLTDRGRTVYVYAAEALAALTGVHLWLTVPWLFQLGVIEKYWLLFVMAVAFAGAGLSELFHRRRMPVLSEPLERTALLLPLVPAIAYWFTEATSGETWFLGQASPAMWLLMGLFYGFMAVNKRSIWLGLLAVLAGNTGLWVLWPRLDISIYEHPQLWLIPVALSALVAEYLNHHRLDKAQSAALRYLALSMIYVSSTADMFIAGVGKDLLTPLILMLLSVFGALAGILLRVRSFLYLGVTFLVLDIVTMVWYAAVHQRIWWIAAVCGIALGTAVLILVGVFEKRRNDILAAVERFKDWEV